MRTLIKTLLIVAVSLLLSGYPGAWEDQIEQVGKTTVKILGAGADTHWIGPVDRSEAIKVGEFVKTYNDIAYKKGPSQDELCQELKQAAVVAIEQRVKRFYGLYEVKCIENEDGQAPKIHMSIYPQVDYGYRFEISFEPTP